MLLFGISLRRLEQWKAGRQAGGGRREAAEREGGRQQQQQQTPLSQAGRKSGRQAGIQSFRQAGRQAVRSVSQSLNQSVRGESLEVAGPSAVPVERGEEDRAVEGGADEGLVLGCGEEGGGCADLDFPEAAG